MCVCVGVTTFQALGAAPPRIILGPENQNVKIGSTLTLECEADGNPLPHIWWKKDGLPVNETSQVFFTDDAIELTIDHVEVSDSGTYVCVAENELGIAEVEAEVVVINVGPPRFLFEPYDLDAIEGTTVEMPCKAENDDILQAASQHWVCASTGVTMCNASDFARARFSAPYSTNARCTLSTQ
uniref:Ig-like domain-containing protein n=1 Tax=Anopheles maculatus TaxID=74869 RepID=A0A182S5N2_9DIPT